MLSSIYYILLLRMSPGNEAAKVHVLCKKNIFLTPSETGISPTVATSFFPLAHDSRAGDG